MSLINQALRKAQRDRTPNRMQPPGEQSPAGYASASASGMSPALVIGLVIAVAVLIGLVAGLSVVIFKGDSAKPAETTAAPKDATPQTLAPTAGPTPASPVDPQITPPAATDVAPASGAPASGVVAELRKAREATEAAAAAQAEAAEEAAARAAAQPSKDIIEWLGRARVNGVRLSETGSKVILNGRAYATGEYVNFTLGLKVIVIQETRILFVDNNGKKYLKRL